MGHCLFIEPGSNYSEMNPQLTEDPSIQSEPAVSAAHASESLPARRERPGFVGRLLHGAGAGAVSYGISIAGNLLLLPLYLRFWSVAVYGEWMALYSAVNYLTNLDFGLTFAAINSATIAYARGDFRTFKRVQGTTWAISLLIAGIGIVAVVALSIGYFHINQWLGLRIIVQNDARIVFCCLAISFLITIPGRQMISVYIAIGEFPRYQWTYNALALFSLAVTAIALGLGAPPRILAVLIVSSGMLSILISFFLLYRHDPHLIPDLRNADWGTARSLVAPTGQVGLAVLATALTLQGPVIVLSRALGGPAVALFTTTRTIANVIHGTVLLLRAPLRPELAAASADPSKGSLRRLFRIAVSLETVTSIAFAAVLWSVGGWLIAVWSHHRIVPDLRLLHLMLAFVVVEAFLQVLASAGWATNKIQGVSIGQMITAIASIALAVVLVGRFGPSAIPIAGVALLVVVMAPLAVRNACKETELPIGFVLGRMLLPFGLMIVFAIVLPFSALPILSPLLLFAGAVLVTGGIFLTASDRLAIRNRILSRFLSPVPINADSQDPC
jgi:O-antigen/teichoic acid export membrane protein